MSQAQSQYEIALSAIPGDRIADRAAGERAVGADRRATPGRSSAARRSTSCCSVRAARACRRHLLERRPDIRQAEQQLDRGQRADRRGQGALLPVDLAHRRCSAARATSLSNLFTGPARTWTYAGQLVGADLHRRRRSRARCEQAEAAAAAGARQLPKTDPDGVRRRRERADRSAEERARRATQLKRTGRGAKPTTRGSRACVTTTATRATSRCCDAERSAVRAAAAATRRRRTPRCAAQIAIYKAMGGGWIDVADRMTPAGNARAAADKRAAEQPLF